MKFSKSFINAIIQFSLLAVFGCLCAVIFNILSMYNISSFHVLVLLISFYLSVTCYNKLLGMILLDLKEIGGGNK